MFGIEKKYYQRTLNLALPVIIANAGQAVVTLADNIMVGHLGALELASVGFAGMIIMNLMVLGTGAAISLTPLVGENFISRGYAKCSQLLQNSLLLNTILGIAVAALLFAIVPLLSYLGQPEEVLAEGRGYYYIVSLSLIPYLVFLGFKQFMDGVGNTKLSMVITMISVVVNIILNWVFIYGKLGAPAMGVFGAGLATFIARLVMPLIYLIAIRRHVIYSKYLKFFSMKNFSLSINKKLFTLGMPIASQMLVEIAALSGTTIMFGWMGVNAMAAGQVTMSIIHILFLFVNGIASAATILTSHEYGRHNRRDIVKYTKSSMIISVMFMVSIGIIMVIFREQIAWMFIKDPAVIAIASSMIIVISFMEIFDGLQVTVLGALRGLKEVRKPMLYAVISYVFIGLPMGYVGGFVLDIGPSGVWLGFLSGLIVAFSLFLHRFYKVVKTMRFK